MKPAQMNYSVDNICAALTKKRFGGTCYFSICGAGETLLQPEVIYIVKGLLKEGHFVNITTNGTLSKKIDLLLEECGECLNRLHIAFSFHFLELKRLNLMSVFFDNIRKVREKGVSYVLQINTCDEYIPFIEEIKDISIKETGALPQVALSRDETCRPMKILTALDENIFVKIWSTFNSPLFDLTYKNFNVKRKEFCYAGDWSFVLNLSTGILTKCYANKEDSQNIFQDVSQPIRFAAIGRNCKNTYCVNSSHFMTLGVIPSIKIPTYAAVRKREGSDWYNEDMEQFLSSKLYETNKEYGTLKKFSVYVKKTIRSIKNKIKRIFYKVKRIIVNARDNILYKKTFKKNDYDVFFVGTPTHTNLGDSAIAVAQTIFLQSQGYSIKEITFNEYNRYSKIINKKINKSQKPVFLIGGGNMGNQWLIEEILRRNILRSITKNNIFVFPQTIFYTPDAAGDSEKLKSVDFYNNKKNLILVAREKVSFDLMKDIYPNTEILLSPDIVLSADPSAFDIARYERKGILFILREDPEKAMSDDMRSSLINKVGEMGVEYRVSDMYSDKPVTKENRAAIVSEKMNEFAAAKLVVTDRLHGMVFAAITATPCIVFGNYNQKVKGTYDWISYLPYIKFTDSVKEAEKLIPELMNTSDCKYDNGPLKPYFEKIKEVIAEKCPK